MHCYSSRAHYSLCKRTTALALIHQTIFLMQDPFLTLNEPSCSDYFQPENLNPKSRFLLVIRNSLLFQPTIIQLTYFLHYVRQSSNCLILPLMGSDSFSRGTEHRQLNEERRHLQPSKQSKNKSRCWNFFSIYFSISKWEGQYNINSRTVISRVEIWLLLLAFLLALVRGCRLVDVCGIRLHKYSGCACLC